MAKVTQYTKVKFEIIGVDQTNEDGQKRQDLLKRFLYRDIDELTFNRVGTPTAEKHQTIEVMVDGCKVGELSDEDYIQYQTNIQVARDARIQIYEEELENGESYYTADACIVVPYIQSVESRMKYVKRKKMTIICMGALFLLLSVWFLIKGELKTAIFGIIMSALMGYWGLIRKPEKDDKVLFFLKTGKKQHKIGD